MKPMLENAKMRALPLLNKTSDLTPAVGACCGACRTCVTTNVFTLAAAAAMGLLAYGRRVLHRA
jgi:hypothetical protein